MVFPSYEIVDIVELVCYAPLSTLVVFLAWRHGRRGLLGYFYLNAACALRGVYCIVSLVMSSSTSSPSTATVILGSIGLTPLLLALAGFVHEAHLTMLNLDGPPTKRTRLWLWFAQFQFHGLAMVGIVLIIVGNVKLYTSAKTLGEAQSDEHLRAAGAVLLLVLSVLLLQYAGYLTVRWPSDTRARLNNPKAIATCSLGASVFVLAQVGYMVADAFDVADSAINPITGSIAIRVVFSFLVYLFAVTTLVVGGWKSRNYTPGAARTVLAGERPYGNYGYESVRVGKHEETAYA